MLFGIRPVLFLHKARGFAGFNRRTGGKAILKADPQALMMS
jgi:hypothetical protein